MQKIAKSTYQTLIPVIILLFTGSLQPKAQDSIKIKSLKYYPSEIDSILIVEDSAYYLSLLNANKETFALQLDKFKEASKKRNYKKPEFNFDPKFSLNGGWISYTGNYRSFIDTPYLEKNVLQHNVSGQLYGSAFGLPLQAIYYLRQTNSSFFRNIYDVQLSLDPVGVRRKLNNELQNRINKYASSLEDSIAGKTIDIKQIRLDMIKAWLNSTFQKQRIVEAHEILEVPKITFKPKLSPEQNTLREDSIKRKAARFLDLYAKIDSLYTKYHAQLDSAKQQYADGKAKAQQLRTLSQTSLGSYSGYLNYKAELKKLGIEEEELPKGHKALMSIRKFSLGRSSLNHSELTAKNISINGINAEYNSWFYAAVSAGLVDFRFRDFAVNATRQKQYLAIGRLGVGNLDNSFIIFSAFTGRKQLFATNPSGAGITTINIRGYGLEGRWRLNKNIYVNGEVAESISPDFRNSGNVNTKPGSQDYSNNAFSLKLSSYYPLTGSRVEGFYKYTGSNYQSFSNFQTNSSLKSWYLKGDQYFIKKIIKLSLSIRSNDFSNPYVIQDYQSNTVFKSAGIVFRKKNWPVISAGYLPMSQYTSVNGLITENRFQSLNTNIYYLYKIGNTNTASTIMYNKFYNSGADTGFIYFNASNIYFTQNIFLGKTIANLSVSDTRNEQYECQVFDESLQMSLSKSLALTTGVKINNFNRKEVKVGGYLSGSLKVWEKDIIHFSLERGYLPGINDGLVGNDMATIQFIRTFGSLN